VTGSTLRASSISGTMAARVAILAGGLVTGIISARALGPSGRGQYFAATTAAAILAQLTNLGLASSNVFLGARDPSKIRPLLLNSAVLSAAVALLCAAAIVLGGPQVSSLLGVPGVMLWATGLLGSATLLWNLAASLLVAMERFAALNVWQVVNALLACIAIVSCGLLRAPPGGFALASALSAAVTAAGLAFFIGTRAGGPVSPSVKLVRSGVGFSARAYVALLLAYLLQRSGASLLVGISTASELGQYSIASQVFDVLLIVPSSISLVLYPLLVRRTEDLWHDVRRTTLLTTVAMLVLCAVAAITAPFLLPLIFGARYAGSVRALWALLPTVIAYSIVSVLSQYLVARSFPRSVVLVWALGLAAALLTGFALTRSYGAFGAALSQSIGAGLVCCLILVLVWRRTELFREEIRQ